MAINRELPKCATATKKKKGVEKRRHPLLDLTWFKLAGTAVVILVADANLPLDGFEKIGALGLLGLFIYFTLTRLESSIKDNATAIRELRDYLITREPHGH